MISTPITSGTYKIVKPWCKSKSLSEQNPKLNKSPPKKGKKGFGPRANTKITWATRGSTLPTVSLVFSIFLINCGQVSQSLISLRNKVLQYPPTFNIKPWSGNPKKENDLDYVFPGAGVTRVKSFNHNNNEGKDNDITSSEGRWQHTEREHDTLHDSIQSTWQYLEHMTCLHDTLVIMNDGKLQSL